MFNLMRQPFHLRKFRFQLWPSFLLFCWSDPRASRQYDSSEPEPEPAEPFLPLRTRLLVGGIKWPGRSSGKSNPSSLTLMRCIARANSSESNMPSWSTSANLQTLARTGFGSRDLIISFFATDPVILPLLGPRDKNISSHFFLSYKQGYVSSHFQPMRDLDWNNWPITGC